MNKTELLEALTMLREGDDVDSSLLPSIEDIRNERRRRSLLAYVEGSTDGYKTGWVHKEICTKLEKFLQDCIDGKSPRLMLFLPPRHGKSQIASKRFPAWSLGNHPELEFIVASYSADLSTSFSTETRELCEGEYHRNVFTEFELGYDQRKNEWSTSKNGMYKSAGVGGSVNGRGADVFIIDDPVKNWEEAYSLTHRERVWNWFTSVAYTRLSPGAGVLLIMTRWHEDDLAGRLLSGKTKDKWEVINYPAIATADEPHRSRGEALHKERYPIEALKDIKDTSSERVWASLYQQKPRIEGGSIIKREWFSIISKEDVPEGMQWRRFWDLAVSSKQTADYSASPKCAMDKEGNLYIDTMLRFKKTWASTKKLIVQMGKLEKIPVGIETVSAFEIALQEVKPLLRGVVPVRGYKVTKDKLTRALPWIDLAERGKVFLVDGHWNEKFLDEVERFDPIKDASHDDQIDGVSGAYQMVKKSKNKPRIL